jgi:hypothetical protein
MSATFGLSESSKSNTATPTKSSGAVGRSLSFRASNRQRSGTQTGGGYTADYDLDDDEEADYEGEDGDDDEEDQIASGEYAGGKDLLNESTIKSGYLWKRGEKRKVRFST